MEQIMSRVRGYWARYPYKTPLKAGVAVAVGFIVVLFLGRHTRLAFFDMLLILPALLFPAQAVIVTWGAAVGIFGKNSLPVARKAISQGAMVSAAALGFFGVLCVFAYLSSRGRNEWLPPARAVLILHAVLVFGDAYLAKTPSLTQAGKGILAACAVLGIAALTSWSHMI